MKMLILKGLPASGKSTYAKGLVENGGWVRVNKDDLREMLHNSKWSGKKEQFIIKARDILIKEALKNNLSVVVDDTNLHPKHEIALRNIAREFKVSVEVKFIDTSVEECIKRDLQRAKSVGKDVILDMYNTFLKPKPEVYTPSEKLPCTIVVDIDGTLAIMSDRSPYAWDKVGEDTLNPSVARVVKHFQDDCKIVIVSGRDEICRKQTEQWLRDNGIKYDKLFMRPQGDMRKDSVVKKEIYDNELKDKYRILFIMDDRNQVVEMWRSLGISVFQVNEGNF